ncbi:MAG: methyltransferase domain-containing protein [Thermoguttaceae bacterium]|jgi:hypothetical protein
MSVIGKTKKIAEYGDFQTPLVLAQRVSGAIDRQHVQPNTIIEPTCGKGAFLKAAAERFPDASKILGIDINPAYVEIAKKLNACDVLNGRMEIRQGDFYAVNFADLLLSCVDPILVIGNPPWVTNTELGSLGSCNAPKKSNFQGRNGLDAITGKANFDISEWMLIKLLENLNGRKATLAMLCKTAVARKVLYHVWKEKIALDQSSIHLIDADRYFGVSVEACLLVCNLAPGSRKCECDIYEDLDDRKISKVIGFRDELVIANVEAYERWKHLRGKCIYKWRSGVKHDCGKIMELWPEDKAFRNGLGEIVELEPDYIYPMLKTSEVANGSTQKPKRWMLITQQTPGEDTSIIKTIAPKTWKYLNDHADALDRRGSSIYRKRSRFSVFGIGDYTFAPWKVAISGFYKRFRFAVIGPYNGKPIVLDDASYFIACQSEKEAFFLHSLLSSEVAQEFYSAFVFWDAKRPITVDVLKQLNLIALAKELGLMHKMEINPTSTSNCKQHILFE